MEQSRDIQFLRILGPGKEDILRLDRETQRKVQEENFLYQRITKLPFHPSPKETEFYGECFSRWKDGESKVAETKVTEKNRELGKSLGMALKDGVERYRDIKQGVSFTMEKNFAVKLLYWFDFVMEAFAGEISCKKGIFLAFHNIIKEQEYLFCYMLAKTGAKVYLLQSRGDIENQRLKELSAQRMIGNFREVEVPEFSPGGGGISPGKTVNTLKYTGAERVKVVIPRKPPKNVLKPGDIPRKVSVSAGQGVSGQVLRQEMSFEELALLASSVVMITIHDRKGKPVGSGSGIMIGRGGYILTNHHVASGGNFYSVKIEDDGETYSTTEVIKYNPLLDLAVIRIDRILKPLPIYQGTKKLVRGQKVVAIGSPLGLFNSVSDGIISGFRRIDNVDMIQFTAPISHGSSGGAVLNMYGEVIGISTAGIDDGQNINLAVGYEFIRLFIRGFTDS